MLASQVGDRPRQAAALGLGARTHQQGENALAEAYLDKSVQLYQQLSLPIPPVRNQPLMRCPNSRRGIGDVRIPLRRKPFLNYRDQECLMSIKIGLYDFFAYTIPGVFYLAIATYSAVLFGWLRMELTMLNGISLIAALFLLGAGYVTGIVMDALAELWHRLFNPKGTKQRAFHSLRKNHPGVETRFQANDFGFLLAYLRNKGGDQVAEVERVNVYGVLLRNISLGFAILFVVHIAYYFVVTPAIGALVLASVLLALSGMAGFQGAKFRKWFYEAMFDAVVGEAMKAEDFFARVTPPVQAAAHAWHDGIADTTGDKRV